MNGYERMLATLKKEPADYTPSTELMIDETMIQALTGTNDYKKLCAFLDLDAAVTVTPSALYRNKMIDEDKGLFVNEWGTIRQKGREVVPAVIDYPVKTVEDIYTYEAPDPLDEYRFTSLRDLVKAYKGKRFIGMIVHDAFSYPNYLMGMENLFYAIYDAPDAVHRLVDISVQHNIALARKAVSLGADFILLSDDYGGSNQLLVSPKSFREFFLPGLQKVVHAVKKMGAYCFKHCCGNINSILGDLVSTGIDVLHPLDPSAGMDILKVKESYPNLVVMGGISCYEPLSSYSIAEIAEETKRVIASIGANGRFIIASSNSVHSDAKPENFLTMHYVRKSTPIPYDIARRSNHESSAQTTLF